MVKVWSDPLLTVTVPDGVIVPLPDTLTVILYVTTGRALKDAAMVWAAVTFVNVYDCRAPAETPSTVTSAISYPADGVIVNVWLDPLFTVTVPEGVIVPPVPAEAVMLQVTTTGLKLALMVWLAVTLLNVYEVTAPAGVPSTVTPETA